MSALPLKADNDRGPLDVRVKADVVAAIGTSSGTTDQYQRAAVHVEPTITDKERVSTVRVLCKALMGVAIAANELLGFTRGSGAIAATVEEFDKNGWTALD